MSRWTLLLAVCLGLLLTTCAGPQTATRAAALTPPPAEEGALVKKRPTPTVTRNPFGVMMNVRTPARVATLQDLHVGAFRTLEALVVEGWDGGCPDCEVARAQGLRLVLSVRANGGGVLHPTSPPADLAAYQAGLGRILDAYHPDLLVVESEENSALFYTGTPAEYAVELKAACEVAHRRSIPCTNGGLVSGTVALLTWADLFEGGDRDAACDYARRAAPGFIQPLPAAQLCQARAMSDLPTALQDTIAEGKAFLRVYAPAGADLMNFHWYIPDARALEQTAAYLKRASGLPLVCNEMGQHDADPAPIPALLQTSLDLGLAYAVWFNSDTLNAAGLSNLDGSLRPNGVVYRDWMRAHF